MADKLIEMVALTTIETGSGKMVATGEFDTQGAPIFDLETVTIPRGTRFKATPEERAELLRSGAAEEVEA